MFKKIYDDVEMGDCDASSGCVFLNRHNLSQRDYTITFTNIDRDVDKGGVSSGYDYMNSHTDLQRNDLVSLMNDNDRIGSYMNETL